ncbi:MAG: dTMP kinase [Woeseia sp.]
MGRGKFITVEGIEGVGKSTNIDFLSRLIEDNGFSVVRTREPGGTPVAERIRDLLLEHGDEPMTDIAELLLFFAARSLHISNAIRPALDAGQWVVCDRFTDASRAYQGQGRGLDRDTIDVLAKWVTEDLQPDLTILLDAPAEVGMDRAGRRGDANRLDVEKHDFYTRVRKGYLALADSEPDRFTVIDASQPLEQVQAAIGGIVSGLFSNN